MRCVALKDGAGESQQVGRPEMEEDWEVGPSVLVGEAQLFFGERVGAMFVDLPVARSAWHAQDPCAVSVGLVEATRTPETETESCVTGLALGLRQWLPPPDGTTLDCGDHSPT